MRGFERWRVVDAVARHRHHFALRLQRFDDAQFLLRQDAGEDEAFARASRQRLGIERVERVARDGLTRGNARLPGDGERGRGMVAGDHHDGDAGGATFRDRLRRVRAQGIGEAGETEEGEIERLLIFRRLRAVEARLRDAQHPQALARHLVHLRLQRGAGRVVETTEFRNRLRRAFAADEEAILVGLRIGVRHREQVRPQAVARRKPHLCDLRAQRAVALRQRMKRALHRIDRIGCARQPRGAHKRVEIRAALRVGGIEGRAGGAAHLRHAHAVLGERAGLVGA